MLTFSLWAIIKVFVLIFLVLYVLFSLVVIKQVALMTATLEVGFETQLKLLSYIHFLFAAGVLIFGFIIL